MAGQQMVLCCALLVAVTLFAGTAEGRPNDRPDDITDVRGLTGRPDVTVHPAPVSVSDGDDGHDEGWTPSERRSVAPPESAGGDPDRPHTQDGNGDGVTEPANQPNINTDDAEAILHLTVDVTDIPAVAEADPELISARSARRVSQPFISEEEAERAERRDRTRFAQSVHGSNVVSHVSTDFQNGTFMAELYGTENPWLQKYAPFYYPQNPLPTQLNHQSNEPPPVRLRQVHIGDTVLVPPKVQYSDQVLRTIHDAKLRSLPKPKEDVHIPEPEEGGESYQPPQEEQKHEYEPGPNAEEHSQYGPPHVGKNEGQEDHSQYGPPQGGKDEGNVDHSQYGPPHDVKNEDHSQYGPPRVEEDKGEDAGYEWMPKNPPGTGDYRPAGNNVQPEYTTANPTTDVNDSAVFSKPGPPYGPDPNFPADLLILQQSPAPETYSPAPNTQNHRPETSGSPVPQNGHGSIVQFVPAPRPSTGNGHQGGQVSSHGPPRPTVTQGNPPQRGHSTPGPNLAGGLFSPIRAPQRPIVRPSTGPSPVRPVIEAPPTPPRRITVSSGARPFRPPPSPPRGDTQRPRYPTRPQTAQEVVEDNGYSSRVKPDDVIPYSLSYGYAVVVPTTPPTPPPLSQYGKPKASTILGGAPVEDDEGPKEFEDGPKEPVFSTRPLGPADDSESEDSNGFGAPKPGNIISGNVPEQTGQRASPIPPPQQPTRPGYSRPRDSGSAPPPSPPPRRQESQGSAQAGAERPEYSAPKDDDILNDDERVTEERRHIFHSVSPASVKESSSRKETQSQNAPKSEEAPRDDGYMSPKQDDILSDEQAAGFVRNRYFPQQDGAPKIGANRRTQDGFGAPNVDSLIESRPIQEFGVRTRPVQLPTAPESSDTRDQNGFSRPRDSDIVGFNPNSLSEDQPAPTNQQPNELFGRRPGSPQQSSGFSPPRPQDLVDNSENSIDNGSSPFLPDETSESSKSVLEYGPKGYSQPKDADVLNPNGNSGDNEANTFPIQFQNAQDSAPKEEDVVANDTYQPTSEEEVRDPESPDVYSRPKSSDVLESGDSNAPGTDSSNEARPLELSSEPAEGRPDDAKPTEDLSGFGPIRSGSVLQQDSPSAPPSSADDSAGSRPQYVTPEAAHLVPAAPSDSQESRPRPTRRPSSSPYDVDDFIRSDAVSILGAFQSSKPAPPGPPSATERVDVTTQRTRQAPRPVWRRRNDPGPFRAAAALLDAQFADLFVDEVAPSRRRQSPRRPTAQRRPESVRRRPLEPLEPEFGPPFAVLESRADHGWPESDTDRADDRNWPKSDTERVDHGWPEPDSESASPSQRPQPPLKFGSAFAAEPLTPPGLLARRQAVVAPSRGPTRQRATATPRDRYSSRTEAPSSGRYSQRETSPSSERYSQRATPAPSGSGRRERPSPFTDEFEAPFAAPFSAAAASRVSVTAVRPGPNPILDWPKIDQQW